MRTVIAMYFLQGTEDKPALIGLFSDMKKAGAYLEGKDRRKYYTREYLVDGMVK